MRGIAILGSTGSIGLSTLDVVGSFPEQFRVVALAAGRNVTELARQIKAVRPQRVSLARREDADELRALLSADERQHLEIFSGAEGPEAVVAHADVDFVVTAMVGGVGLKPTLAAIRRGISVGIANKEPLVMAGKLCTEEAARHGAQLLPIDSEHSAVFQCLAGQEKRQVRRILLTCSGGPFRKAPADLSTVTLEQALVHPTWSMGPKITIDSATLINKGLEVIEAHWLFGLPAAQIEILIHPQSVIHSMVEFIDGAVMAQLGTPDMRGPIGYALGFPTRLPLTVPRLNWTELGRLTFEEADVDRFPGPRLAYHALATGGTAPAVLNAANEVAVAAFLDGRLGYVDITVVIEETLAAHTPVAADALDAILDADDWARRDAERRVKRQCG